MGDTRGLKRLGCWGTGLGEGVVRNPAAAKLGTKDGLGVVLGGGLGVVLGAGLGVVTWVGPKGMLPAKEGRTLRSIGS